MRRFATVCVGLVVACVGALGASRSVPLSAQGLDTQIAIVEFDRAPVKISNARVVSNSGPAAVAFEATNLGPDATITEYAVKATVYQANGRARGAFQRAVWPGLAPGAKRGAVISLGDLSLESDSLVLINLQMARPDTGDRWWAPADSVDRVKSEAARLTGVAASNRRPATGHDHPLDSSQGPTVLLTPREKS
jgi:hypothetical protein